MRGALDADLPHVAELQSLAQPARQVLVRGVGELVVQVGVVEAGPARFAAVRAASPPRPPKRCGRLRRAQGGTKVAVAVQAVAAVRSSQARDAAGRLKARRRTVETLDRHRGIVAPGLTSSPLEPAQCPHDPHPADPEMPSGTLFAPGRRAPARGHCADLDAGLRDARRRHCDARCGRRSGRPPALCPGLWRDAGDVHGRHGAGRRGL